MFYGCSSLNNINSLEKWNVSNGNNFSNMFNGCSSLNDIKSLENGMCQMEIIFHICLMDVLH